LQELIRYITCALVDNPEQVEINVQEEDKLVRVGIKVAEEDMGKVIGKQGRIAKAIRTLAKASAAREGKRSQVDILE